MPGIEAVKNNSSYPTRTDETHSAPKIPSKANFSSDTLEIQRSSAAPSSSKIAQVFSSFWQWMTTPFSGGALTPEKDEGKIEAVAPSSPLPRPQPLSNPDGDRALAELRKAFEELSLPVDLPKSSKDMWAVAIYRAQSEIFETGIEQGRERFIARQSLKKLEEKEYTVVRKEYDQIGQDTKWWQTANTYAMYAVAGITSVVSLYAFGTAAVGEGLTNMISTAVSVGGTLFAGSSAVTTFAKGKLDYKHEIKQGEIILLRHKRKITDIKLHEQIDFLTNSYSKYNKMFTDMHNLGELWRQTSKSFYS